MNRFALAVLCVAVLLSAISAADNGDSGLAQYSAVQKGKTVTVTAKGENNTGGWSNQLTVVADTNPPEFKFSQKKLNVGFAHRPDEMKTGIRPCKMIVTSSHSEGGCHEVSMLVPGQVYQPDLLGSVLF
jgi:hypothetical protein